MYVRIEDIDQLPSGWHFGQSRPLGTSNFVTLTNVTKLPIFFKNTRNKLGFSLALEGLHFCPEIPSLKELCRDVIKGTANNELEDLPNKWNLGE